MASSRDSNVFIARIIGRVLDRILDTQSSPIGSLDTSNPQVDSSLLRWEHDFPDYPHLELLHTFDWFDWDGVVSDSVGL